MKLLTFLMFLPLLIFLSSCNNPNDENITSIDAYDGWNFLTFSTGINEAFITGINKEQLNYEKTNNPNFVFNRNLVFPTTFNGIRIVRIEIAAFENLGLENVDFSKMHFLQSISHNAFQNNNLTSLNFSNLNYLGYISNNAFNNNDISSISFNSYIEKIGSGAFRNNNLSSVNLKDMSRLMSLGNNAFADNSFNIDIKLQNINSLGTLNLDAFSGTFVTLRLIDLPNLTRITPPRSNSLLFNTIYILGSTHGEDIELREWWINRVTSFGFYNDNIFNLGD